MENLHIKIYIRYIVFFRLPYDLKLSCCKTPCTVHQPIRLMARLDCVSAPAYDPRLIQSSKRMM